MKISVVVSTYNRINTIKDVIEALVHQKTDGSFEYEVAVVDNNSIDGTKEFLKEVQKKYKNLRYYNETKQGQAHALNRGIHEMTGDIILLTDDDVVTPDTWVMTAAKIFQNNPDVHCITGKVLPIWDKEKPNWYTERMSSVIGMKDHGNEKKVVKYIIGANAGYRRNVLNEIGDFSASSRFCDVEYGNRLRPHYDIHYFPNFAIRHRIHMSRLNKEYFKRWHNLAGQLEAELVDVQKGRSFLGAELWRWKEALSDLGIYIINFFNPKEREYHYFRWVYFVAFLKRRRNLVN